MTDLALRVVLTADASGLKGELRVSQDELRKLGAAGAGAADDTRRLSTETSRLSSGMAAVGRQIAAAAAAYLSFRTASAVLRQAATEIMAAEKASANLAAVLKATGGSAGLAAGEIKQLAGEIERTTLFQAEQVTQGAAVLATFRSVSGATFREALKLATDLAALLGTDVQSAVLAVGKALENPEEGLEALSRAGVRFNEEQRKLIRGLMDSGREAEAVRLVLDTLADKVGGVAKSQVAGLTGAINDLADAWSNLLKGLEKGSAFRFALDSLRGLTAAAVAIRNALAGPSASDLLAERAKIAEKLARIESGDLMFSLAGPERLRQELAIVDAKLRAIDMARQFEAFQQKIEQAHAEAAQERGAAAEMERRSETAAQAQRLKNLEAQDELRAAVDAEWAAMQEDRFTREHDLSEALQREWDERTAEIKKTDDQLAQARERIAERAMDEARARAEEETRILQQPFINALSGVQSAFTDAFDNVLSGGVRTFADLGDAMLAIMRRTAAEIAALLLFKPNLGPFGVKSREGLFGAQP